MALVIFVHLNDSQFNQLLSKMDRIGTAVEGLTKAVTSVTNAPSSEDFAALAAQMKTHGDKLRETLAAVNPNAPSTPAEVPQP